MIFLSTALVWLAAMLSWSVVLARFNRITLKIYAVVDPTLSVPLNTPSTQHIPETTTHPEALHTPHNIRSLPIEKPLQHLNNHSLLNPTYYKLLTTLFFFFNDTAPPEIYPLSLHDALPICTGLRIGEGAKGGVVLTPQGVACLTSGGVHRLDIPRLALFGLICLLTGKPRDIEAVHTTARQRSEEHTSELQSRSDLVCRLLLE